MSALNQPVLNPTRNHAVELGITTVPVAPAGVPSTAFAPCAVPARARSSMRSNVFGGTPALPESTPRLLPVDFDGMAQCDAEHTQRILAAAIDILTQGEDLLRSLSEGNYTRRVPVVFNAAIGGHYRHCLDHFTSLLLALDADEVDYDHRKRDPRIETQPEFALVLTADLRRTLEQLTPETLCMEVKARCEVSYSHGNSPVSRSTLARELVYCIAHAIHHYALISVMARLMEVKLPEHFGMAPSTVAHQKAAATK